jgi:hypothetical protein
LRVRKEKQPFEFMPSASFHFFSSFFCSELRTKFLRTVCKPMTLKGLVSEKKEIILQRWLDRVLAAYPADMQRFFRENKSPYSNPIGFTLRQGMEGIIGQVLQPLSDEDARTILEPVMKIRAVENLPPSRGVDFILPLREVLSEIVREENRKDFLGQEWLDLNSRISRLALLGMNLYSECRQKVNQLSIKERRKRAGTDQDGRAEV